MGTILNDDEPRLTVSATTVAPGSPLTGTLNVGYHAGQLDGSVTIGSAAVVGTCANEGAASEVPNNVANSVSMAMSIGRTDEIIRNSFR